MEKRCDQPHVLLESLEKIVWDEVVLQLSDEKVLREKLEQREAELKRGRKDDETELEVLANLEAGFKRDADKLLGYAMRDDIDDTTFREQMAVISTKQEALARSKAEVIARLVQWEQNPINEEAIRELVEIAKDGLPDLQIARLRMYCVIRLGGVPLAFHSRIT